MLLFSTLISQKKIKLIELLEEMLFIFQANIVKDTKNEKVDQKYNSIRKSLSTYSKINNDLKNQVQSQHENMSQRFKKELEDIKSLLLSTREEMSQLLYSTRHKSINPSSKSTEVNHEPHRGYTTLEKTKAYTNQYNPWIVQ